LHNFESQTGKNYVCYLVQHEVEQASRGLSAIAELLVILDYCTVLLPYTYKALLAEMCQIGGFKGVGHFETKF